LTHTVDLYAAKPDIPPESRFLRGSHRNIAIPFGMKKLEWLGYPVVKKFPRYFIQFDATHEHDGHTHTDTHTS